MEHSTTIRPATPADAPGIARVHVQAWRETYRGILPDDFLEAMSVERRENYWRRVLAPPATRTQVYVADADDGGVVGFVAGGPERNDIAGYDGEIYAIYLLKAYHGRGMGRQLFDRAMAGLAAAGYAAVGLWVLENNPTRGFYEHLGGQPAGRQYTKIGDSDYPEVAYGWRDLANYSASSGV